MAWQYSDYIILDNDLDKYNQLKLHVKEVADKLAEPMSFGGELSWSREQYQAYLATLKSELNKLKTALGKNKTNIPFVKGRISL